MKPDAISPPLPLTPTVTTESGVQQATQQIDRITYIASLASRFEDIDPLLDPLRGVTASWDKITPLTAEQQATLDGVESRLKNYLLHTDPLRAFTPESLEERIRHSGESSASSKASRNFMYISILSFVSLGVGFVLPFNLTTQERLLLATPMLFTVLSFGTVWFYLTSLNNFKEGLRKVFAYFCAAAVVLALGFSQFPFIELFDLNRYPELRYVGISILFGLPFVLLFLGLRSYASLLGITSRLLSLRVWLPAAAAVILVSVVLPHKPVVNELFFDLAVASGVMISAFGLMGSILANKIRKQATATYSKPLTALLWYLRLDWPGGLAAVAALFALGELQGVALNIVLIVCGVGPQFTLLFSGYLFKRETSK